MVESWRLNKHTIYAAMPPGRQMHLFIMFTDKKMPGYETVKAGILKGIEKLLPVIAAIAGEVKE